MVFSNFEDAFAFFFGGIPHDTHMRPYRREQLRRENERREKALAALDREEILNDIFPNRKQRRA